MYMTSPITAEGFQWHLWRGGCHVNVITLKQPCLYRLFVFMEDGLLDSPAVVLKSATSGVLSLISVSGLGCAYWRQLNWTALPVHIWVEVNMYECVWRESAETKREKGGGSRGRKQKNKQKKKNWPQASGTGEKDVQIHVKSPWFPHPAILWWCGPTTPVAHLDRLRLLLLKLLPQCPNSGNPPSPILGTKL